MADPRIPYVMADWLLSDDARVLITPDGKPMLARDVSELIGALVMVRRRMSPAPATGEFVDVIIGAGRIRPQKRHAKSQEEAGAHAACEGEVSHAGISE